MTLRGNHRLEIFFRRSDRLLLNEIVAETLCRYEAKLHAYCWMTNHVHMLIEVGEHPLGRIMRAVASRYARTVQVRFDTTGHLFERRYHEVIVDADAYLLQLLRYIHLNPVRAELVRNAGDYEWSSHHAYAGRRVEPWVTTDLALSLFDSDPRLAGRKYCRFMDEHTDADGASPLAHVNNRDFRVVGDDEFLRRLLIRVPEPGCNELLDDLIAEACTRFSVRADELRSASKRRDLVRARGWIAQRAEASGAVSIAAVGRALNRDESSVRNALRKHQRKLHS